MGSSTTTLLEFSLAALGFWFFFFVFLFLKTLFIFYV